MGNGPVVFLSVAAIPNGAANATSPIPDGYVDDLAPIRRSRQQTGNALENFVPHVWREDAPKPDQGHFTWIEWQYARRINRLYTLWIIAGATIDFLGG